MTKASRFCAVTSGAHTRALLEIRRIVQQGGDAADLRAIDLRLHRDLHREGFDIVRDILELALKILRPPFRLQFQLAASLRSAARRAMANAAIETSAPIKNDGERRRPPRDQAGARRRVGRRCGFLHRGRLPGSGNLVAHACRNDFAVITCESLNL